METMKNIENEKLQLTLFESLFRIHLHILKLQKNMD